MRQGHNPTELRREQSRRSWSSIGSHFTAKKRDLLHLATEVKVRTIHLFSAAQKGVSAELAAEFGKGLAATIGSCESRRCH